MHGRDSNRIPTPSGEHIYDIHTQSGGASLGNPVRLRRMATCEVCSGVLSGRQRKYCCRRCKNRSTNTRNQIYRLRQLRGRKRKLELLRMMGTSCSLCGYARNHAALEFHHRDQSSKSFQLDLRSLSNRCWRSILEEARKCSLVCSNCHAEIHNPHCSIEKKPGKARLIDPSSAPDLNPRSGSS